MSRYVVYIPDSSATAENRSSRSEGKEFHGQPKLCYLCIPWQENAIDFVRNLCHKGFPQRVLAPPKPRGSLQYLAAAYPRPRHSQRQTAHRQKVESQPRAQAEHRPYGLEGVPEGAGQLPARLMLSFFQPMKVSSTDATIDPLLEEIEDAIDRARCCARRQGTIDFGLLKESLDLVLKSRPHPKLNSSPPLSQGAEIPVKPKKCLRRPLLAASPRRTENPSGNSPRQKHVDLSPSLTPSQRYERHRNTSKPWCRSGDARPPQ